jgi:hypothetical protein
VFPELKFNSICFVGPSRTQPTGQWKDVYADLASTSSSDPSTSTNEQEVNGETFRALKQQLLDAKRNRTAQQQLIEELRKEQVNIPQSKVVKQSS